MSLLILLGFVCEFLGRIDAEVDCSATPIPLSGTKIINNVNTSGPIAGTPYDFEAWTNLSSSNANYNITLYEKDSNGIPSAAFKAKWENSGDFLARVGIKLDEGKKYTEYGEIVAEYAYTRDPWRNCTKVNESCSALDCSDDGDCTAADCACADGGVAGDYSYIGVYGWTKSPLVEYYVVDDWFGNQYQSDTTPVGRGTICYGIALNEDGTDPCLLGEITVDGAQYKVFKRRREAQPSIEGTADFDQYFSVRNNQRKCGKISVTEHFKQWASKGLNMEGALYEAKLLAESGGGKGWIDYSYGTVQAPPLPDSDSASSIAFATLIILSVFVLIF